MLQHLQPSRTGNKINMDHVSTQNQCIFIKFPYLNLEDFEILSFFFFFFFGGGGPLSFHF